MSETKVFYDKDVDISILKDTKIAIIGYGNQGQAHALNYRDSGLDVIVGNIKDEYWTQAEKDGFPVYSIDKAVELGDIAFILVPDEIAPDVYENMIKEKLTPGKVIVFASGYNVAFGFIKPPEFVDVVLEAPRMIGIGVRSTYVEGSGHATLIAVHQNPSGKAKDIVLAMAKASGGTGLGAFETTFKEEAELDLFSEQGCLAGMYGLFQMHFEVAVEAGYNPDIVVLELWKSGELSIETKAWADAGIFKQMKFHSHASQYGSMTRAHTLATEESRKQLKKNLEDIQNGIFSREFMMEQMTGFPVYNKFKEMCLKHPINKVEERLDNMLKGGK